MQKPIILIGGTPTVGKSTIAKLLSKHLSIPWISTDQIRIIMRATANRADMPKLFNPENYSAEKFLTKFTAEEIVDLELEQGDATWIGIKTFIEDDYVWSEGFIIEGVNILPNLIARDFKASSSVKGIFLVDGDEDRTREVVYTRGLWDNADRYSDNVKEKEVEWSMLFDKKIRNLAKEYDYPCIEITKSSKDLQSVLAALDLQ
ncbi:MAG: AAA family ATPase [Bdellovibrionota bacterium]